MSDIKHAQPPHQPKEDRLSKRVAQQMPCSRSEAERYIAGGWVKVDGQVVEEPMFRVTNQIIAIDPNASLLELQPVTLLLHKPPGFDAAKALKLLAPATHAADDTAGIRILKRHFNKLDTPVALETAAGGLLVFTQDWRVARKLHDDASVLEQELLVEVAGGVAPETLRRIHHLTGDRGQPLPQVKVSVNSSNEASSKLRFAVKGVHLGLIAHLCDRVGLQILSMKRLRIGRVALAQVPIGQWRYLQPHERF